VIKKIEYDINERMKEKSKRWNKLLIDGFKFEGAMVSLAVPKLSSAAAPAAVV
jgi:hypothetical protein